MKSIMNFTTSYHDLDRYLSNDDLKSTYRQFGLDGLELMQAGDDERAIVRKDDVIGVHLKYFNHWLSLWKGDMEAVLAEYDTVENCESIFGGTGPEAIIAAYEKNLAFAKTFQPEYLVFHVSDITLQGSITRSFKYTDIQVIDAAIDLLNTVFPKDDAGYTLLFENLWWSGLTMEQPELLGYLMSKINYPSCGVMLDIGHLLHTNRSIRTLDEGIDYIYSALGKYRSLDFIKGIHLHQTLSGEYVTGILNQPFELSGDYRSRLSPVSKHVMKIDSHKPFVSERIPALVEHINPEYLVFELLSSNREEHVSYLKEQISCFAM